MSEFVTTRGMTIGLDLGDRRSEATPRDRILVQARGGLWAVATSLVATEIGLLTEGKGTDVPYAGVASTVGGMLGRL